MKRLILISVFLLAFSWEGRPASFEALRHVAVPGGTLLGEGTFIEGIIAGCGLNAELNLNVTPGVVDTGISAKTAYIESLDGRWGFRLKFESPEDNTLAIGDRVRLNLAFCTVSRADNPERYTIYGLRKESIQKQGKFPLPEKVKRLSELADDDLYTRVTISGMELLSKEGSWSNIYERCAQLSIHNRFAAVKYGSPETSAAMDGHPTLLLSSEGGTLMMIVNSLCPWRRGRLDIPQGSGPVSGVLVHHTLRRYGWDVGRYCLRPMSEEDLVLGPESAYETLCSWDWDRNVHFGLRFSSGGEVRCIDSKGRVGDVLPDRGEGVLSSEGKDRFSVMTEYDARNAEDGQVGTGGRTAAALRINTETSSWYDSQNQPQGLVLKTSTSRVRGKLFVCFSFAAGIVEQPVSGFPLEWTIQYSTDGHTWKASEGPLSYLRPLQYRVGENVIADAAMGFTEHVYILPEEASGQKKLFVRLLPASRRIALLPASADASIDGGLYDGEESTKFTMALGMISIKTLYKHQTKSNTK